MQLVTIGPNDYKRFSYLEFNRQVNVAHVEKLSKSIDRLGFITIPVAIETEGKLAIIDGQHRIEAGKALGLDIPVAILPNISPDNVAEAISILNTTSRNWRLVDYFYLYHTMGNKHYKQLATFMNKSKVTLNYALHLWRENPLKEITEKKNAFPKFKNGTWKQEPKYKEQFGLITGHFFNVKSRIESEDIKNSPLFSDALIRVILHPEYDQDVMIKALETFGYDVLPFASIDFHFNALAALYNRESPKRLTWDYQIAINGTVVTSDKEAQAMRERYVSLDQYAAMSPYAETSVRTNSILQPNKGKPDIRRGNRKYWLLSTATKWAAGQHRNGIYTHKNKGVPEI